MDIKVLREIMELAKKNRMEPNGLCPVFFFFMGNEIVHVQPAIFGSDVEKELLLISAGVSAKANSCDGVMFLCDGAMRRYTEEEARYVTENLATEAPLVYPVGHPARKECIILVYLNFVTGGVMHVMQEYVGDGETIVYGEVTESQSGFEGLIVDTLKKGYANADKVMEEYDRQELMGGEIDPADHFPTQNF
jgi:hypothetical protein